MKRYFILLILIFSAQSYAQNPADRDPSFNPFVMPIAQHVNNFEVRKLAFQADQKLLILAENRFFRRIGNDLDTSFNTGIFAGYTGVVNDFVIQPDGKIIAVGGFTSYNGTTAMKIARINTDGSIDPSFVIPGDGFGGEIRQVNLQPDGKILVSGYFGTLDYVDVQSFVRLNSDGSRDQTFTPAVDLGGVNKIFLQPDGKILVAMQTIIQSSNPLNRFLRLNSDGSIDTSFSEGNTGTGDIQAFKCQTDGKIVIVGNFTTYNSTSCGGSVRLNMNGTIDDTYIVSAGVGIDEYITDIIFHPDGKMTLLGRFSSFANTPCFGIVRLNTDGSKDLSFDTSNGIAFTDYNCVVRSGVLQPNGKMVIGGYFYYYNALPGKHLARINSDGTKDETFTNFTKGFDSVTSAIIQQPDGKNDHRRQFWQL